MELAAITRQEVMLCCFQNKGLTKYRNIAGLYSPAAHKYLGGREGDDPLTPTGYRNGNIGAAESLRTLDGPGLRLTTCQLCSL
ncbi:hypothetical protein EYF80_016141 [Liparis tanakae]|uniref:Uncharacterized protein n=1 Tax=Liparis tanakae TaxID=230148 RepID=A0A4Z2I681_9TELE|nr:hypothetical protein EYF80_016141 [Liparis tanakae]